MLPSRRVLMLKGKIGQLKICIHSENETGMVVCNTSVHVFGWRTHREPIQAQGEHAHTMKKSPWGSKL